MAALSIVDRMTSPSPRAYGGLLSQSTKNENPNVPLLCAPVRCCTAGFEVITVSESRLEMDVVCKQDASNNV